MSYYGKPKVTLPVWHSEKDAQWLTEHLLKLHPQNRITACTGYSQAYREAFESQSVEFKKENSARKAANTRMRKFVDKCLSKPTKESYNQKEYKTPQNQTNFSIDSL